MSIPPLLFPASNLLAYFYIVVTVVLHVAFAWGVLRDSRIQLHHFQRAPFLVPGILWALSTLLGGVTVAAIYWVIHHSKLRPQSPPPGP